MKIRVKFTRNERVKFLGHLDIMRTFQRAFMRAKTVMIYSEGFNPHQKMNFAQPLGVGVTSSGEYMDVEIADGQNLEILKKNLDTQMGEGFDILDIRELEENAEKCMAAVRYAYYAVTPDEREQASADYDDILTSAVSKFTSADKLLAIKKTKSCETEIDIKQMVYKISHEGKTWKFLVSAGSENNLKPDLLLSELFKLCDKELDRNFVQINREALMAENFVLLENLGTK